MAGYLRRLIPGIWMLCLLLVFSGQTGQGSQSASGNNKLPSGFVIPQKPKNVLTPSEQKGKVLYAYYCAICHGDTEKGDGFNSYCLLKPPRNFTDCTLMEAMSDNQIKKAILEGGAALGQSMQMPGWGGVLTEKQASELKDFLRTVAKKK